MPVDNIDALRARDDLLAVAASWPSLRCRLRPTGIATEVRTAPGSKPPIVIAVSDLMRQIEDRTRYYGNKLLAETKDWKPSTSLMPGLLVEVAGRFGHFTSGSERVALDFLDDAHEMRRLVSGALAQHEPAKWAGPCPDRPGCDGQIYQRPGSIDGQCRVCGRVVGQAEWRALMRAAFDTRLMSLSELVSALVVTGHDVPEKTVRTWANRGALHGDPHRGLVPVYVEPTLYRFSDGYALAERRAERSTA